MNITLNWQKQRFQCPQQQRSSLSSTASPYQNDCIKTEPGTYVQSQNHQQFHAPSYQLHQNDYQTPRQQVIMTPPNSMIMHQTMSPMINGVSIAPIMMPTSMSTPILGPVSATPLTAQFTSAHISAAPMSSMPIRMTSPPPVYQTVYPPQMPTPPSSVVPVAGPSSGLPQKLFQNLDSNYLKDILKNVSSDAQTKTDGRRDSTDGRRDQTDNQTASRSDGQFDVNKMSIKQLIDEIPKINKEEQQCKQFKETLQGKVKDLTGKIRELKQELDKYSRHLKNQTERYERITKRKDEVMDAIKMKKDLIPDDLGLQLPSSSDSLASSSLSTSLTSRPKQIVKRSANEAQKAHKRVCQDIHDVFGGEQQSGVKRSMPVRPGAGARKQTENQQKNSDEDEEESDDNEMINQLLQLGENSNQDTDNQDNLNDNSNDNQENQNDDRFKMIIIKEEKQDLNDNSTKTNQGIISKDSNSKDNSSNEIVKGNDNSKSSNDMVKQKYNAKDNQSTSSFEHLLIKQEKRDIKNQIRNLSIKQEKPDKEMQNQVKIKQEKKEEKFKIEQEKKDDHNDDDDDDGPLTNRILGAVTNVKKEKV